MVPLDAQIGLLREIAALSGLPLAEMLHGVLSRTASLLDLELGIFSRIEGDTYTVEAVYDESGELSPGATFAFTDTYCSITARSGDVVCIEAMGQSIHAGHACYAQYGMETYIGAPVTVGGQFYGTLCFTSVVARTTPFSDADADLIRLLASWVGTAVGRMRDSEARRRSEHRLAKVLDAAPDAVVLANSGRIIEYVNPAFERLFECPAAQAIGQPTRAFYARPADFDHQGEVRFRADATLDRAPYLVEYRRADGTTFLGETVGGPVAAQGEAPSMLGFVRDVTEREAAREREADTVRAQAEAVRAKERFLANMSHEMRTPLNAVLGLGHLLGQTPLSADQSGLLDGVTTAAGTLLSLIDDLLDFARLGAGQLPIETIPYAPAEVVEEVRQMLYARAREKGILLQVTVASDLPPTLLGDPTRLRQVLLNLASNAVKFTSHGSVRVTVRADREAEGARLHIEVTDTGVGIPADRQTAIFDPFVQAASDAARRFGGTGLGLAIVKELVERQDGHIMVESVEGEGSTFRADLWAGLPTASQAASQPASAPATPSDLTGVRILVVEDNATNRLVARRVLENWGVIVSEARDGHEAIRAVADAEPIDLVLMDLQMPEMDGIAATRYIREVLAVNSDALPILALTASVLASQHEDVLAVGFDDFLLKPFDPPVLRERIATWTGRTLPPDETAPEPVLDPDELSRYTNGDPTLAAQVASLFLADGRRTVQAVAEAASAGDLDALSAHAHVMKGQAGYVGASTLAASAGRLAEAALQGDRVTASSRAPLLARQFHAAAEELARLYPQVAFAPSSAAA